VRIFVPKMAVILANSMDWKWPQVRHVGHTFVNHTLVAGFKHVFVFTRAPGEMIPTLT